MKKSTKCKHKHKMFIGYKPEHNGTHDSEIWKCYSCEKFIYIKVITDWKNAQVMEQGDFDFQFKPHLGEPKPKLKDWLKKKGDTFQHHSGV